MHQNVNEYVKACPICKKNKVEHTPYPGLLAPLPVPEMAWTHISMDFVEGLPKSNSKDVILVVVDRFTKYANFFNFEPSIHCPRCYHFIFGEYIQVTWSTNSDSD